MTPRPAAVSLFPLNSRSAGIEPARRLRPPDLQKPLYSGELAGAGIVFASVYSPFHFAENRRSSGEAAASWV
jgi:hypothetical protein